MSIRQLLRRPSAKIVLMNCSNHSGDGTRCVVGVHRLSSLSKNLSIGSVTPETTLLPSG